MSTLETTLAQHQMTCYPALVECDCGWQIEDDDTKTADQRMIAAHVAHVADQVRAHLMSEQVIDRVSEAIAQSAYDDDSDPTTADIELWRPEARAALAAALNTNQPTNGENQ